MRHVIHFPLSSAIYCHAAAAAAAVQYCYLCLASHDACCLVCTARCITKGSCNSDIFCVSESHSPLGFLKSRRSNGAISSSDCCCIRWSIGEKSMGGGRWCRQVTDRFHIFWYYLIWHQIGGDLMLDQIISSFIICPASALPSAGGPKFDNSALIDANFESIRRFAPARHLMSFDITS